jgi:hypothetical protein
VFVFVYATTRRNRVLREASGNDDWYVWKNVMWRGRPPPNCVVVRADLASEFSSPA